MPSTSTIVKVYGIQMQRTETFIGNDCRSILMMIRFSVNFVYFHLKMSMFIFVSSLLFRLNRIFRITNAYQIYSIRRESNWQNVASEAETLKINKYQNSEIGPKQSFIA